MVFEPNVNLTKTFISQMDRMESFFRGQGFVYAVNPRFNHGSFVTWIDDILSTTHRSRSPVWLAAYRAAYRVFPTSSLKPVEVFVT